MDHEISQLFINALVETFGEPKFESENRLKFVENSQDAESYQMRFELFPNDDEQQILAAWTITLRRENNISHLKDYHG